ncbi:uncharacterized protein LOC116029137 [Ipomoea triloba]|uniref:uncharacterized protein LOC116029137 n=1 Tax=Ipomoea triloba TaxID=35885 RepID=UPI00125D8E0F|nr:uncharacterized protein LOC116029137 [Ipomoea triloba]
MAMGFQKWLVFVCLFSCIILLAIAQPELVYSKCGESGNYTQNSIYQSNLNTVLSSLSSNLNQYGFSNVSMGENPDRVSAPKLYRGPTALCRGDVEPDICHSCVEDAGRKMVQSCPNQTEAFGWYDECMIYYSNVSTLGSWTRFPEIYLRNVENSSSTEQFNKDLQELLESLRDRAANGFPPLRKFAAGNTSGPAFQTIYAAVQCSPDLSAQACSDCLVSAFADLARCDQCTGKIGGGVVRPSCNFRFKTQRFFNYTSIIGPPPTPAPEKKDKDNDIVSTVIIVIPLVVIIIILTLCIWIIVLKKRHRREPEDMEDEISTVDDISTVESLQYNFGTIRTATNNFSNCNKLGQGGFGPVYKGELPNGQEIAVKRLSANSGQGDLEFKNEVLLVAKLQHKNLVRLLGFCLEGRERLLVYKFVPNASLDHTLFDPVKRENFDWKTRYKIISGISRGLLYLHEDSRLRIIYRDLKASNVLRDAGMNPKISDFGMARLFEFDESEGNTSKIVGTYGYMVPEYVMHGQFSVKSDVFSFGVLVLEIVSGQKNNCFKNGESVQDLLSYAWRQWREGTALNLVDPFLRGNSGSSVREIVRCIHIALLCVQENVGDRPTMSTILLMLSSSSLSLPLPSAPAFFMHTTINPEAPLLLNETTYSSQNEAWRQWREGTALNLVDPFVRGNSGSVPEMMRCIHMALLCVQENVADRPTMSTVVLVLSSSSLSLPMPSAPAFFMHSAISPEAPLLRNEAAYSSQNEASITEMDFQKWLVFLYISSIALLAAAQPKLRYSLCNQTGNYEHNSIYHHNLNTLLSSISSKLNEHGFYNASTGQNPDRASVTALCRGDVEPEKCRSCVDNAARKMVKVCPNEKGAFGGYEECMIRYSNESTVAGSWSRFPQLYFYIDSLNNGSINSSSQDRFDEDLRKLLDGLRDRAANGGDFLKFAGDNATGPELQTIYAVVQCSPELSAKDCSDCLTSAFGDLSKCPCHGKRRGGIIRPSCNFRYENYSFFDYNKVMIEATPPRSVISIALPPNSRDFPVAHNYLNKYSIIESELDFAVFKALPPNSVIAQPPKSVIKALPPKSVIEASPPKNSVIGVMEPDDPGPRPLLGESNKNIIRIVIIIVVAVFIILTICVSILVLRKRQKRKQKNDNDSVDEVTVVEFLKYDFGTIKKATNNFSDSNRIGQGGFGPVYKGKLNGHDVAVKRLSRNSGQGDREFRNEVILVGQLQHRNLVRLLGFSLNKRERLLVYEFVPNASLDYFLFDPVKRALLDWNTRYKIISGISKGLLYLHEDSNIRIIHRDLKPSNVLLNTEMNPKISDFGMARLYDLDESHCSTSRIVGTYGYMAPEYAFHGQFSVKSDTFSFGVLVLEIISGQKSNCFRNGRSEQDLLSNAWAQWREGTALNLVDPILRGNSSSGSVQEMMKCIHMALLCVQENVGDRPTMSTVVLMLSGSSLSLPLPSAPPFFMHSSITPEVSPQLPEQNSTMFESLNETSIADAFFP